MNCQIAPSILSFDHSRIADAVINLEKAGADWIHFDIMDGQFVPPITFGAGLVKSLRSKVDLPFEAHLMTNTPEAHFEAFIEAGCKRIIFHAEATHHAHRLAQTLRASGVEAGLAINPGTPVSVIEPVIKELDFVLIMTVNPGWGGQKYIKSCNEKVRQVRLLSESIHIEVDGGVDPKTFPLAAEAGADYFVVGNFLASSSNLEAAMQEIRGLCASR